MYKKQGLLIAFGLLSTASHAALFNGGAFFSFNPFSQVGLVTNNLTITNTAFGFTVSGQVMVTTPPGAASGILVEYEVVRALDPTFGSSLMTTYTEVDGFCVPPSGSFGNTSGICKSYFTNFVGPSDSQVFLPLPGGAATWPGATYNNTSSPFVYTSGGTNYLVQHFFVDGVQLSGPGGPWVVDVPVYSVVNPVPEPASLTALALGLAWLARRRSK